MESRTTDQTQLRAGTKVESADGVNLGTVKEIQLKHYLIEKGLIFKHDLYEPYDAIANYDGDTAWLNVTKAEIVGLSIYGPVSPSLTSTRSRRRSASKDIRIPKWRFTSEGPAGSNSIRTTLRESTSGGW